MSSCLWERLHRKIGQLILLKNHQLRSFTRLVLDSDFLLFTEVVEASDRFLEEFIHNFETYPLENSFSGIINSRVKNLCEARDNCLRKIEGFRRIILNCEESVVEKIYYKRLERTRKIFHKHYQAFQVEIENLFLQLLDIYEIFQFQNQINRTNFLYFTIIKNHINICHILPRELLRFHALYNISTLILQTHKLLHNHSLRFIHLLDEMDPSVGNSMESIRDRLNQEISKSRTDIVIQEAELAELRQELFPSEISLKEQRHEAIDRLEIKELDLEHRIRSIDLLQTNIQGLEEQVAQLIEKRERIHEQLMVKRDALRSGIREVVRLEKLILQIEQEISNRMVAFQQRLEELELKRLAILEDPTLTDEERARLLAEIDQEITKVREKHDADQQLLIDKCEELKAMSRSVLEGLDSIRDELLQKHLDEIKELEERMKNATPSELEIINARIQELQKEFEENMAMLDVAQARRQYFEDEFGRYYINEYGQKVYQRASGASEYIMTEDGCWEKIKDGMEKQVDEKGEFYMDSFGRKIYTKRFYQDEFGKYYIDNNGKRIYLETSVISEARSSVVSEAASQHETSGILSEDEHMSSASSFSNISEEVFKKCADDVEYVQDTVGLALRKGLALTFLHQPEDPIEFLANFLEKYNKDQLKESERSQLLNDIERLKEEAKSSVESKTSNESIC